MIMCFICKKINRKKEGDPSKFKDLTENENANQYKFQIKLDQSSEFLRTWPVIKAVDLIADSLNMFKEKIYFHMSEYFGIANMIDDYKIAK